MDTFAALAFGGEGALRRYMQEAPIKRDAAIISPRMWSSIFWNGLFVAAFSITFLINDSLHRLFSREHSAVHAHRDQTPQNDDPASSETHVDIAVQGGSVFLTAFFCVFLCMCAANAFNVRTTRLNLLDNITSNLGFAVIIPLIFVVQILFTEFGGKLLRTVPLTLHEWQMVLLLSFLVVPWDLARKLVIGLVFGKADLD
eukprot:c12907_g2_i1.p2 GENE.c12907_g2_i1~~c12907_g2_i1.p2  ORF type:complete len:200 (+),score=39.91 c12907_g2_i1:1-600(+)